MQRVLLKPPKISKNNIIGYRTGLRPHRQGGIRLQGQNIKNKYIMHNYGHGGAGFSFSYGTSFIAIETMQKNFGRGYKQCSVIGSGFIGLMTAIGLSKKGYKVKIYSAQIPNQQGNRNIVSQIAPGYWMPYKVQVKDNVTYEVLCRLSYDFFQHNTISKAYKGLNFNACYVVGDHYESIKSLPIGIIKDIVPVQIDFSGGAILKGHKFTTIFADAKIFLRELREQALIRGVTFQKKMFNNIQQLLQIPDKFIFNCCGLGSYKLFNDKNVIPVKGCLLDMQGPVDYFFAINFGKRHLRLYPNPNKLIIGIEHEEGEWNQEVTQQSKKNLYGMADDFFNKKIIPKL